MLQNANIKIHINVTQEEMSMKPLYIYFFERYEYIIDKEKCEQFPVGKLLISFLDFEWDIIKTDVLNFKTEIFNIPKREDSVLSGDFPESKSYFVMSRFYQKLYQTLLEIHPLCGQTVDHYLESFLVDSFPNQPVMADYAYRIFKHYPNPPMTSQEINDFASYADMPLPDSGLIDATERFATGIEQIIGEFIAFKDDLLSMIEFSLGSNGKYSDLPTHKRYFLMRKSDFEPLKRNKALFEKVRIERKLLEDVTLPDFGSSDIADLLEEIEKHKVNSYTFYRSNDLRALVLLEFDYMCCENFFVRKCENCGRFFQPYSQRTIYCDRIFGETGKICKEIAPVIKYRNQVNNDEAKKYYQRLNNTYQMRCSRSPACYSNKERYKWQVMAKELLQEVNNGNMNFEEFKEKIMIPEVKG